MFQGATSLSLDAKGRMAIPARHRESLLAAAEGRLVMTAHPHRCLLLYPAPDWAPIRAIKFEPDLGIYQKLIRKLKVIVDKSPLTPAEEEIQENFSASIAGMNLEAYDKGYRYMAEELEKRKK